MLENLDIEVNEVNKVRFDSNAIVKIHRTFVGIVRNQDIAAGIVFRRKKHENLGRAGLVQGKFTQIQLLIPRITKFI